MSGATHAPRRKSTAAGATKPGTTQYGQQVLVFESRALCQTPLELPSNELLAKCLDRPNNTRRHA
eukprot:1907405-Alexandrium_andersonii.AAC.1